jgi:hypothetical protein
MDPDFELGIGPTVDGNVSPRPKPTFLVRGIEMAGLALVIYGLGAYRFWLAAVGGALIVGSYALYRRKHGPALATGSTSGHGGSDFDGGGD